MNVLFLSLAPIASLEDRGIYPDLLRIFVKNGHFVRIISVQPDCATYDDRREGYAVLHVQTPQMQKVGLLKKGIASLQIGPNIRRALDRHCRNERYDLILMATPPITLAGVVERSSTCFSRTSGLKGSPTWALFPRAVRCIGISVPRRKSSTLWLIRSVA